jgi:hypothetical protein
MRINLDDASLPLPRDGLRRVLTTWLRWSRVAASAASRSLPVSAATMA